MGGGTGQRCDTPLPRSGSQPEEEEEVHVLLLRLLLLGVVVPLPRPHHPHPAPLLREYDAHDLTGVPMDVLLSPPSWTGDVSGPSRVRSTFVFDSGHEWTHLLMSTHIGSANIR